MKKFGTPIGAGPGSANEKVGLAAVGTPPWPEGFGLEGCFFEFVFDFEELGLEFDGDCFFLEGWFDELWCCDGFCTFAGARVCGG
jgi:hypothetical protein